MVVGIILIDFAIIGFHGIIMRKSSLTSLVTLAANCISGVVWLEVEAVVWGREEAQIGGSQPSWFL